jgi:intein/homing endonuclease
MFYNEDTKEATYGLIHYIEKLMVKKRLYRIKIKDKYVDVTEDHSVMVIGNDGILFEKKPKDICKGDKVINIS